MLNLLFADGGATVGIIMSVVAAVIILLVILIALATRYKKCPSDKIMVIFGSGLGKQRTGKSVPRCVCTAARAWCGLFSKISATWTSPPFP